MYVLPSAASTSSILTFPTNAGMNVSPAGSFGPFTMCFWWYRRSDAPETTGYLFNLDSAAAPSLNFAVRYGASFLYDFFFPTFPGALNSLAFGSAPSPSDRWHHIAIRVNRTLTNANQYVAGDVELFVNGVAYLPTGTSLPGGAMNACDGPLSFFNRTIDLARLQRGCAMSNVGFFKRALTTAEIEQLAGVRNGAVTPADLSADYHIVGDRGQTPGGGAGSLPTTTTGTSYAEEPGFVPGLGGHYAFDAAGVTESSGRIVSVADKTGLGPALVPDSTGPVFLASPGAGYMPDCAYFDGDRSMAGTGGPVWERGRCAAVMFGAANANSLSESRYVFSIGGTTLAADMILTGLLDTASRPSLASWHSGAENRPVTAALTLPASHARPIFWSAGTGNAGATDVSGVLVQLDRAAPATANAPGWSGSSSGVRIGTARFSTNALSVSRFVGFVASTLFYQRPLTAAARTALYEWGKARGWYADATKVRAFEGSSTFEGTNSSSRRDLLYYAGPLLSDSICLNYAQGGTNGATMASQFAAEAGAATATNWFASTGIAEKWIHLHPFGNDWDGTTASATIAGTWINIASAAFTAGYTHLRWQEAIPRGDYGPADATQCGARETQLLEVTGLLMAAPSSFTSRRLTRRFAEISPSAYPGATLGARAIAASESTYFSGDRVHLGATGYQLGGADLLTDSTDFDQSASTGHLSRGRRRLPGGGSRRRCFI